jgi:uncharacterized protein (DUF433 family)
MNTTQQALRDRRLSPRVAAFVAGVSERTVNQAIDRGEIRGLPGSPGSGRRRLVAGSDLVYLKLRTRVGPFFSNAGKRRLRDHLNMAIASGTFPLRVEFEGVSVDIEPALQDVQNTLAEIERAENLVTADPGIQGGQPVVRGTRVPVHVVSAIAGQGETEEGLLHHYPSLTPERLRAALLYAELHPARGRPATESIRARPSRERKGLSVDPVPGGREPLARSRGGRQSPRV